ncbi:MAG TPA: 50S ribosomal protein L13 [Candidatus Saccharibacteria bacterium]|nr:50S ribosomal protein L13 [Candidatus Saccharibacteria bacterium]HMT39604.1 50S ribosomal protein L13 [Candidatus Saccharibacteria bacterium]
MKTYNLKTADAKQEWYIIDAKDQVLGRLATKIARLLIGKDKPNYTPHVVSGDVVVVINSAKVKVTGQKLTDKIYYRHTGYPGGIREINLRDQLEKNPNKVIEHAVEGMLPKNKLQAVMLKNLKVYSGNEHPHAPQNPKSIKIEDK